MKNTILLITILFLSSCGILSTVYKEKDLVKMETSQRETRDSLGLTIDKSIITIKEKLDTLVSIPAKTFSQGTYLNMDSLINGITVIKNDLIDVNLVLNPITRILTAQAIIKSRFIPVKFDRETSAHHNVVTQSRKAEAVLNNSRSSSEHILVNKEPKKTVWFIILFIVIAGVVVWLLKKPN
ncbi:hypothetical protein H7F33_14220 [Pedobacter sp. PAMC26386]|nr:hypothetical protein H7F33_14220 [Pedobacter sp. PAMC26386]